MSTGRTRCYDHPRMRNSQPVEAEAWEEWRRSESGQQAQQRRTEEACKRLKLFGELCFQQVKTSILAKANWKRALLGVRRKIRTRARWAEAGIHVRRLLVAARYRALMAGRGARSATVVGSIESVMKSHRVKRKGVRIVHGGRRRGLTMAACVGPVVYEFSCQYEERGDG